MAGGLGFFEDDIIPTRVWNSYMLAVFPRTPATGMLGRMGLCRASCNTGNKRKENQEWRTMPTRLAWTPPLNDRDHTLPHMRVSGKQDFIFLPLLGVRLGLSLQEEVLVEEHADSELSLNRKLGLSSGF